MKTTIAALTTGLAALAIAGPALADDRWDRHDRDDRHEWRDDRNDRSQAYRKGYRDGLRADDRRDRYYRERYARGPVAAQPYYNGSRWDQGYRYGNSGYRYDNRYPSYRGASYRGSNPYWWGSNGQIHCRRQDGTTGLVVGAIAGGTLGNVLAREGDKRLGSVIGGTLGAVLGNELARGNVRCR